MSMNAPTFSGRCALNLIVENRNNFHFTKYNAVESVYNTQGYQRDGYTLESKGIPQI